MAADPETPARYRKLAEVRFSLEQGVGGYLGLYKAMLS
jgi:hypothetical protein